MTTPSKNDPALPQLVPIEDPGLAAASVGEVRRARPARRRGPVKSYNAESLRATLLGRAREALVDVVRHLERSELTEALAAPTDAATLLHALTRPGVAGVFTVADPLAKARLRGLARRDALLEAEGGALSSESFAERLHVTRQAVDKRRLAGKLLALDIGRRGYLYPTWQLVPEGVLPGLEDTLEALRAHPPLAKARFFLDTNARLGGDRPLDLLRRGEVAPVLRAATAFAEQGAA
jgi:hypothetical protein